MRINFMASLEKPDTVPEITEPKESTKSTDEKPLYTTLPNISIEILDCIEDAELIEEYKGYATEQEYNFEGQHPWNS